MKSLIFMVLCIFLLSACATTPVEKVDRATPPEDKEKVLSPAEQKKRSLELFNEILNLVESPVDRRSVLPRMEKLYMEIISKYPQTGLAQESYWKLINIYLVDYSPPHYIRAHSLYSEFLGRYPRSPIRGLIEWTLVKRYYNDARWDDLIKVCAPAFETNANEGKKLRPALIFICAEAHFHLGNFVEAEKGYVNMIELFPDLRESEKSKARLEEMRKKGVQANDPVTP